jgi:hypothetical protein
VYAVVCDQAADEHPAPEVPEGAEDGAEPVTDGTAMGAEPTGALEMGASEGIATGALELESSLPPVAVGIEGALESSPLPLVGVAVGSSLVESVGSAGVLESVGVAVGSSLGEFVGPASEPLSVGVAVGSSLDESVGSAGELESVGVAVGSSLDEGMADAEDIAEDGAADELPPAPTGKAVPRTVCAHSALAFGYCQDIAPAFQPLDWASAMQPESVLASMKPLVASALDKVVSLSRM